MVVLPFYCTPRCLFTYIRPRIWMGVSENGMATYSPILSSDMTRNCRWNHKRRLQWETLSKCRTLLRPGNCWRGWCSRVSCSHGVREERHLIVGNKLFSLARTCVSLYFVVLIWRGSHNWRNVMGYFNARCGIYLPPTQTHTRYNDTDTFSRDKSSKS